MAFKEGVAHEDVNKFREFVAAVRALDVDIDAGLITPDEAFQKAALLPKPTAKKAAHETPEPAVSPNYITTEPSVKKDDLKKYDAKK